MDMDKINKNYFTNILELCDGDYSIIIELSNDLIEMFTEETFNKIEEYIQEEDGENLAKTAHKLRSAVVNFNMDIIAALLLQLEQMGKFNHFKGVNEKIELIKVEMCRFKQALEVYKNEIESNKSL